MGELTDFLVWVQKEQKAGRISLQTVKVVGYTAFEYIKSQGKEPQFPKTNQKET